MGQTDDRGVCEMFVVNQEEIQKALSIINAKRTEADIKAFNDINKIGDMINLVNYSIRYFGKGMALVLKLRHEYEEVNIIENANASWSINKTKPVPAITSSSIDSAEYNRLATIGQVWDCARSIDSRIIFRKWSD